MNKFGKRNRFLVLLRSENKELREREFVSVASLTSLVDSGVESLNFRQISNVLYEFETDLDSKDVNFNLFSRTAFTNNIFEFIVDFDLNLSLEFIKSKLERFFKSTGFEFDGSFAIRIKKIFAKREKVEFEFGEDNLFLKEMAKVVWRVSRDKRVDLVDADNVFSFIFTRDKIFFVREVFVNQKKFLNRMPIKRPRNNPYTLKSDLARACVNFLQVRNGLVVDNFCGLGAILLEAKSFGLDVVGCDISWRDLLNFNENFSFFFKQKPKMIVSDTNYRIFREESVDGFITDIPYGKSTKVVGEDLYLNFVRNAFFSLKSRARIVVICSNYFNILEIMKRFFEIEFVVEEYINKSMTRFVVVGRKV